MQLNCGNQSLSLTNPVVMGILNVTPDSFSDGGKFTTVETASQQAVKMLHEGASIIDIGGESTRPGAARISAEQECDRVIPVITSIRSQSDCIISVDTSKPAVMREAVNAGANLINDVRALQEEGALKTAAELDVPVCLMHMQGDPDSMQRSPHYNDVVAEVKSFLLQRAAAAVNAGIARDKIIIDPGFGFGKTLAHNLALFKSLKQFVETGFPLLVGVSRKSMVGAILNDAPTEERLHGSVALAALASYLGARILRVHDVKPTIDAIKIATSVTTVVDDGAGQKEVI